MESSEGITISCAKLKPRQIKHDNFKFIFICVALASLIWTSSGEMVCKHGFQNFAGETYPPGDIVMQEGDTLDVYCSVNLTHPKARGYNASNLQFLVKKHEIPDNLIHKEIINDTTIRLRVEKMNESIVYLDCLIEKEDGEIIQVCQKHVEVGHDPLEIQDFHCYAPGWAKLICTWRRPNNKVFTKYNISYTRVISKTHGMYHTEDCPAVKNHPNGSSSCEWNRYNSNYRPNEKTFHFTVNGTNALNKTGVIWNYSIDHFSIVIPDAPLIESLNFLPPNKLLVNYTFKFFEHFQPGLEHNITICSEAGDCSETILSTHASTVNYVVHEDIVPYSYVNYTVTVCLRSGSAKRSDDFWSPPASATTRTPARVPDYPPKTDIGSFVVYHKQLQNRDIYVYWEQIPSFKENGPNFHYDVFLYENEIVNQYKKPDEINHSFAKFVNLSDNVFYKVEVFAANEVGHSKDKSTVVIPNSQMSPGEPQLVSKFDYTNGTYAVTWTSPLDDQIVSYSVFRCINRRPHQCNGLLKWEVFRAGTGNRVVYDKLSHENGEIYQFAVSANTAQLSSGIVWASCSLLPNRVPDRLKTVRAVSTTDNQIRIEWDLDCSYQDGVIEGFRIVYCQVNPEDQNKCGEEMSAITLKNKTYTLKNLQPFSNYKIGISIQTNDGESQQSRPIYAATLQGAPSDPPILQLKETRNTSIFLSVIPPQTRNGIIRIYKIWVYPVSVGKDLKAVNTAPFKSIDILESQNLKQMDEELLGLKSNTNYSIQSSACTVKCSEKSDPIYVTTKIGATNFNTAPSLKYASGEFKVTWKNPAYVGGPVNRYEVMVEKNGKIVNNTEVHYSEGELEYVQSLEMDCDANTNLTAKIRSVTILEDGQELSGDWSQEGYVACFGNAKWWTWFTLIIILLVLTLFIGFAGHKFWNYYKECSDFDPKLPPGLEKELYPCNPIPSKRKNSIEDVQTFSRNNLFQLQCTSSNPPNEQYDILQGLKHFKQRNYSNEIIDGDGKKNAPVATADVFGDKICEATKHERESNDSPWLWQVVSSDEPMLVAVNSLNAHELSANPEKFNNGGDCLPENQMSLSAMNPLLSDHFSSRSDGSYSQNDVENLQIPGQPYKKLGMLTNANGDIDSATKLNSNPDSIRGVVQVPHLQNDYANQNVGMESEFSSPSPSSSSSLSPNSPEKVPATSRLVPDVLTNNASYVKWTQLLPDLKSDAISNRQSSPYCQVGII